MGLNAWYYSVKGGVNLAYYGWVYPHLADGVLIYQIKTTATVHLDWSEMVSINYWVEHQGSRSSMPDIGRIVPVIKSERAGCLGIKLGGYGLCVSCVYHVYHFDFW